jgi:hypothetical protein
MNGIWILHLVSMICVKSLEWSSTRNDCVLLTEDYFDFHQCWNNNVYNNHQLKKDWSNQCWIEYLYQKHSIHFKTIVFRSYPNLILFCMLCNKIIKPFLSFIVSMETLILWGNNFKRKFFKKFFLRLDEQTNFNREKMTKFSAVLPVTNFPFVTLNVWNCSTYNKNPAI